MSAQIRRAAVSVPSNIAEGQSCGADGRYIQHLRIALGSVGELVTQMELAVRLGFITSANAESVDAQLARTRQLLFGLLRSVRRRRLAKMFNSVALVAFDMWFVQTALLG